jgi:hypothetical protein
MFSDATVKYNLFFQNYWVFGLFPSSGILENRKHDVSETRSVFVLKWGGKTPTQLGPIERANLHHWVGVSPPSLEDGNRSSFRNVVFSIF